MTPRADIDERPPTNQLNAYKRILAAVRVEKVSSIAMTAQGMPPSWLEADQPCTGRCVLAAVRRIQESFRHAPSKPHAIRNKLDLAMPGQVRTVKKRLRLPESELREIVFSQLPWNREGIEGSE
jgi:hypothetical protein